jgi:glycopeptide antibiotics resistance protein
VFSSGDAPGAPRAPIALIALALVYTATLLTITLWPASLDATADNLLESLHVVVPWLTPLVFEVAANAAIFFPFGLFLALLFPRVPFMAIPMGFALSLFVEVIQGALLDGRTASLRDVIANTTGATLGMLVVLVWRAALARTRHGDETRGVAG